MYCRTKITVVTVLFLAALLPVGYAQKEQTAAEPAPAVSAAPSPTDAAAPAPAVDAAPAESEPAPVIAAEPVEPEPAPSDPKAEALLARAMEYLENLDRVSVNMLLSLDMQQGDQSVQRTLEGEIQIAGEDQLVLVSKNDKNETRLISDGKTLTVFNVSENTYFKRPAPERKQLIGMMGDELTRLGSAFVSAFLHNDPEMFEMSSGLALAGSEEIGGVPCEKVQLHFPDFDLTAWIGQGETPLLQQLRIDLTRAMREAIGIEDAKAIVEAKLSAWELEPTFEMAIFNFSPPEGATEEDPAKQEEGASSLVGNAAPDIKLELLDGGEMSLASHQGKDIVVLDFWATWCGPCRRGLPIVSKVAKSFEDKNVVFYAVNIEEDPIKIRAFLDAEELEIPVALDAEGTAQQKYEASSIPTTVIVGKDGKVQAVHTGIGPNTEQELQEQLTTLTDGGTLL